VVVVVVVPILQRGTDHSSLLCAREIGTTVDFRGVQFPPTSAVTNFVGIMSLPMVSKAGQHVKNGEWRPLTGIPHVMCFCKLPGNLVFGPLEGDAETSTPLFIPL
jgi:hypothetical protein